MDTDYMIWLARSEYFGSAHETGHAAPLL